MDKKMKWEYTPVEVEYWTPKVPGESVEGFFISEEESAGQYESNLYVVDSDGKKIGIWGTKILDQRMGLFHLNDRIKIVFNGKKQAESGKNYKDFSVFKGSQVLN